MSSKFVVVLTTNNDANTTAAELAPNVASNSTTTGAGAWEWFRTLSTFIEQEAVGRGITANYYDNAVAATGTYTATGQPSNNDTASVNGVTFTAVTGTPTTNQFKIGATQQATMANFAAAINASTTAGVTGVLTASASGSVVTITALIPGRIGNGITTTSSLTNVTAGAATLTGGSQSHVNTSIAAGV